MAARILDDLRYHRRELLEADRLVQEAQPRLAGSPLVLRRSGPADHHDGRCAAPRPYRLGNLEARQSRHEEVRDHGSMDERVKARQALLPVSRYVGLMSQQLDELREDVADLWLIIDDKHLHY